jgi:hypothetical protein
MSGQGILKDSEKKRIESIKIMQHRGSVVD